MRKILKNIIVVIVFTLSSKLLANSETLTQNHPKGSFIIYNLGAEPSNLNPITSNEIYSYSIQSYTDDTLAYRDLNTYEWKPRLAEKWEISKDNKVFTFYLRKNAFFHDGQPITAKDVKFSFDVIFDPKFDAASRRPYYEGIEKVEIIDDYTIKFYVKENYFRNFDTCAGMVDVLPQHIYGNPEIKKTLNKKIIAAGPYTFEKYDKGNKIVLKKFDKWYGYKLDNLKDIYKIDEIIFKFISDENVQLEALQKGNVDYIYMRTPEIFNKKAVGPNWGPQVKKFKVENMVSKTIPFMGFNFKNKLFQDRKVRLALTYLMNRQEMLKKFRDDMSYIGTGPIFLKSEYASPNVKAIPFDPLKAAQLLAEAGWKDSNKNGLLDKDGQEFRFTLQYANQNNEKYYTWFKEDLKKAGIDMDLKYMEWNSFAKSLDDKKFDMLAMSWNIGSIDWDPKPVWHSSSAKDGSNYISYSNTKVDELIDEARQEMDKSKRIVLLQKVYELIAYDVPHIFLWNEKYEFYATTARVGKSADTLKYDIGSDYWWIEK